MSLPKYSCYEAVEAKGINRKPEHWDASRLRFVLTLNPSKQEAKGLGEQEMVSFLPMEAIGEDGSLRLEYEKELGECLTGYTYFRDGDVCVAKITPCFENGKGAILRGLKGGLGFGTTELIVARPRGGMITAEFLDYLFRSQVFRSLGESEMYGAGGQKRVPDSFVRDFVALIPSTDEQNQVTNFLNRETAKIDALIAEQQRLIELLQEKRQAVISHAVTKGLNPNAPMKDSGVEWLGEVPEHWEIRAIKHLVSTPVTDGPHETPQLVDHGVPFISAEAVSSGTLDFNKKRGFITKEEHERFAMKYRPAKHDIYMVKSGATTGVTAIVETNDEFNIWSPLAAIRCGNLVNPYYLLAFMRSRNFQSAVMLGWNFGTQQNIGMKVIENLAVAVPPIDEQRVYLERLDTLLKPLQSQLELASSSINLLQERRSALISAAVTGQIDVRGLATEEEP